jgi:hypothetical protein
LIQLLLGCVLSEQAKITHIQEEIKHARRNEMFGYAIAFVSLLAFWFTEGLYQIVSGLVVIARAHSKGNCDDALHTQNWWLQ